MSILRIEEDFGNDFFHSLPAAPVLRVVTAVYFSLNTQLISVKSRFFQEEGCFISQPLFYRVNQKKIVSKKGKLSRLVVKKSTKKSKKPN